jgi:hypothetical protein
MTLLVRTIRVIMTVNTGGVEELYCLWICKFTTHLQVMKNSIDNIDDTVCYPDNTVEIYNRWGVLV